MTGCVGSDTICIEIRCSKHIGHLSAAEGQETHEKTSLSVMEISAENKLAPYLNVTWRTGYEGKILEFWCRYSQLVQK